MPLCTTTNSWSGEETWGWALRGVGPPCVAHLVCAMPTCVSNSVLRSICSTQSSSSMMLSGGQQSCKAAGGGASRRSQGQLPGARPRPSCRWLLAFGAARQLPVGPAAPQCPKGIRPRSCLPVAATVPHEPASLPCRTVPPATAAPPSRPSRCRRAPCRPVPPSHPVPSLQAPNQQPPTHLLLRQLQVCQLLQLYNLATGFNHQRRCRHRDRHPLDHATGGGAILPHTLYQRLDIYGKAGRVIAPILQPPQAGQEALEDVLACPGDMEVVVAEDPTHCGGSGGGQWRAIGNHNGKQVRQVPSRLTGGAASAGRWVRRGWNLRQRSPPAEAATRRGPPWPLPRPS